MNPQAVLSREWSEAGGGNWSCASSIGYDGSKRDDAFDWKELRKYIHL